MISFVNCVHKHVPSFQRSLDTGSTNWMRFASCAFLFILDVIQIATLYPQKVSGYHHVALALNCKSGGALVAENKSKLIMRLCIISTKHLHDSVITYCDGNVIAYLGYKLGVPIFIWNQIHSLL